MARLSEIRIAGWKSIRNMEHGLELGPLNVLIGANGSGKSNRVSFFKLLSELEGERLQTYIGQSGGADSLLYLGSKVTPRITMDLQFEADVGHPVRPRPDPRRSGGALNRGRATRSTIRGVP